MLACSGVTVRLGGRPVVDGVTLVLRPGEVTALLGPNGAGKSTLLSVLAGLRTSDAGAATLDGQELAAMLPRERARLVGFLPQSAEVHWELAGRALVALGRFPHRGPFAGESEADRAAVDAALRACDAEGFAGRPVSKLSGGERARLLLARLLAGEPRWMLADEPLAGLDAAHQLDMLGRFRAQAAGGAGVLLVLHDLLLAERFADRRVVMHEGQVAADTRGLLDDATLAAVFGVRRDCGHLSLI